MKRLFIVLLAFVFVAGFVGEVAAEDRLSLSGSMRVKAWDFENYGDFDDSLNADETSFFTQRFRLGVKIKPTEFVTAHLRLDFAEGTWGDTASAAYTASNVGMVAAGGNATTYGGWEGSRYGHKNELQVDRAYLQIDQDSYTLKAGQLFQGTGLNYIVVDNNTTGITLTLKLPVTIDLMYSKLDEKGATTDFLNAATNVSTEDMDFYGLQVKYAGEGYTAGAFYATMKDDSAADMSPEAFGVFGKTTLGSVNVQGEIDFLGGDAGPTMDYDGTQMFLQATMNFGTTLVGVDFYYAEGEDLTGTDEQIYAFQDWNDWNPHVYILGGVFSAEFNPTPGGEVFDWTGDDAGVLGGSIFAKFVPMDQLALYVQLVYLTTDEDDMAKAINGGTDLDTATIINLSGNYTITPNATLGLVYSTTLVDMQTAGTKDDSAQTLMSILQITF